MKILYLALFLFLPFITSQNDPIAKTAALIGHGNVPELSKLFSPTVELTIVEDVNTYSNEQAATILTKFFAQNKPTGSHMIHKVNSGTNFLFGILSLSTTNGNYRVAFTLKSANNANQLIEVRIENEKKGED